MRVCLAQKIVRKTCIAPDRLVRKCFTNLRDKICDLRLIFWSERLPTKQGQTCDIVRLQFFYNFVNRCLRKFLTKLKIPSLSIKTSGTSVMTTTHKKRNPESRTIGSIHCFYRSVVHFISEERRAKSKAFFQNTKKLFLQKKIGKSLFFYACEY